MPEWQGKGLNLCENDMFATHMSDAVVRTQLATASPSSQPHLKERWLSDKGTSLGKGWLRNSRYAPRPAESTSTQRIVLQLVACGLSDKDIAHFLGITCATVKAHNAAAMKILGLRRRAQMVRLVFESGWFDPETTEKALELRVRARRSRALATKDDG